jgi:hypothetical protein
VKAGSAQASAAATSSSARAGIRVSGTYWPPYGPKRPKGVGRTETWRAAASGSGAPARAAGLAWGKVLVTGDGANKMDAA